MSGHSKWSTIKHKKAAKDARRGKQWAKLIRQIEVAAREAGTADVERQPVAGPRGPEGQGRRGPEGHDRARLQARRG